MARNFTCPWPLGSSCKKSSLLTPSPSIGIPTRAYRFCSGTGHMLKPFWMKLSTVFDSDEVHVFSPSNDHLNLTFFLSRSTIVYLVEFI